MFRIVFCLRPHISLKSMHPICTAMLFFPMISKAKTTRTFFSYFSVNDSPLRGQKTHILRFITINITPRDCWKCSEILEDGTVLFCPKCKTIQKPEDDINYFQLLGVDVQYDVEEGELSKNYRDLQRLLHPDKFSLRSQEELLIAGNYSSLVNKAYNVLRNPWRRGVYLLQLSNVDYEEVVTDDHSSLLLRVMEVNESLEGANSLEEVRNIAEENSKNLTKVASAVSQAFHKGDLTEAKKQLITLRYYSNIQDKVHEKLSSFGAFE